MVFRTILAKLRSTLTHAVLGSFNNEPGSRLKGLVTDFTRGSPSPAQEYGLRKAFFIFSIPVDATVDFMVSRIGFISLKLLMLDEFGLIHSTILMILAAKKKVIYRLSMSSRTKKCS